MRISMALRTQEGCLARATGTYYATRMRILLLVLCSLSAAGLLSAAEVPAPDLHSIQQVDLIHFSHTDYGFTDHPAVCRDMQRRYLDLALDAALATAAAPPGVRFKWTAETTIAVSDRWQAASAERRSPLSGGSSLMAGGYSSG